MKDINNSIGPKARLTKNKYNIILRLIAILLFLLSLSFSTQYCAKKFNYQKKLGSHVHHFYPPWAIFKWAYQWGAIYPEKFIKGGSLGLGIASIGIFILFIGRLAKTSSSIGHEYLHGSARWADTNDLMKAGLLQISKLRKVPFKKSDPSNDGVYVGGWLDKNNKLHYLRHAGPEHVLCYAPTRSGKGIGLVIPTLLSWKHSAVITDLKGELWSLTSGWRKKHAKNKVLRFEPAKLVGSVCWNPLDEIRIGTEYEVGDAQNLALLIVDPEGKGLESHWQKTSQALLIGLILYALYIAKDEGTFATLASVDAMLVNPNRSTLELWDEMVAYPHSVVSAAARDMHDRAEEESGSVLSTTKSYLSLFRDPVVARNTRKSDFKIKDLMNHHCPVSLYIITQPNDKLRLKPLIRILIDMIIRLLADKLEFVNGKVKVHYKHRLLMMLDEFPSLGKLEILQESLAFIAGYGIKCYLICQDINQLKSREKGYGPDETITSNCHVQNAYPPNRIETAEHLSKLTGQTTVIKAHITNSGKRLSPILSQISRTVQEVQRPLLTPDECLRMPGPMKSASGDIISAGDMLIYVAGYPAIYGKQALYFENKIFLERSSIIPPSCSDIVSNKE